MPPRNPCQRAAAAAESRRGGEEYRAAGGADFVVADGLRDMRGGVQGGG